MCRVSLQHASETAQLAATVADLERRLAASAASLKSEVDARTALAATVSEREHDVAALESDLARARRAETAAAQLVNELQSRVSDRDDALRTCHEQQQMASEDALSSRVCARHAADSARAASLAAEQRAAERVAAQHDAAERMSQRLRIVSDENAQLRHQVAVRIVTVLRL